MEHILTKIADKYPQLYFPITEGISKTPEYRDAVLLGKHCDRQLDFTMCHKDRLIHIDTPVGAAEALLLYNREDFEKCACALCNYCEPRQIPQTVGAFMISGLTNWEKARACFERLQISKEKQESVGLNLLTLLGCDYKDRIILLSAGWYSGIAPERIGLPPEEWTEKSITIRLYHELTHFVCRSLAPEDVSAIRDEIFADMVGLVAAFGNYDVKLAKTFLGIGETGLESNGRIHYYLKDQEEKDVLNEANFWISWLDQNAEITENINDLIVNIFPKLCLAKDK